MFACDTNLLLYAVNGSAPQHAAAARWLAQSQRGTEAWVTSWSTLYEFLRVATHRRVFPRPLSRDEALTVIDGLLAAPAFAVLVETPRHAAVLRQLEREYPALAGSVMHDFHTVALMREHGVNTVYSADAHFRQFTHLRAVNPLAA